MKRKTKNTKEEDSLYSEFSLFLEKVLAVPVRAVTSADKNAGRVGRKGLVARRTCCALHRCSRTT